MGQEKGKSTYSVYPCNASIIICCLRKLLLLLSFASQNWLWQHNRNFELPDKNWALSFDRLILFSAYYIWVCTDIYSNLCILVCIVITYVWSHFLSMYLFFCLCCIWLHFDKTSCAWSRVMWTTSVPILVFLDLSVLDLGLMYATDRQTSDSIIA